VRGGHCQAGCNRLPDAARGVWRAGGDEGEGQGTDCGHAGDVAVIHTLTAMNAQYGMPKIAADIRALLAEGDVSVTVKTQTKSRDVEKKYHAMIADIAKQVTFYGKTKYSAEVWKAVLVEQFANDRAAIGDPLRHPARKIMSMFVEFLYAQGADMGVAWSDPEIASWESLNDR